MKTVFLLTKNGDKTFWTRQGVVFQPNKDGSENMRLDMFPGLTFQIRANKSDAAEPEPPPKKKR